MRVSSDNIEQKIKAEALRLGFSYCGISLAQSVREEDINFMENWLEEGCQADMSYMERNKEKRYDPRLLFEGTKSILSLALNYYNEENKNGGITVAKFAKVKDYHIVMKEKLYELFNYISLLNPSDTPIKGRCFCDSAPVMERYWAWKSGMGWIGRNHCLIIPNLGSFIVLGELFLNIDLQADEPITESCIGCNNCLQICPTEALSFNHEEKRTHFDASKCLAFHTIESKVIIPDDYSSKMGGVVFGCDKCQSVCPHNRNVPQSTIFSPLPVFADESINLLEKMSEKEFNIEFRESTIKRAGYNKLKQNIESQKKTN